MQFINNLIGAMFRVVFMLAGLVFVAGLVMVALVALVLSMLWSLLTGRRHPISVVWTRFRQTQDAVWRASRRQGPAGGCVGADVGHEWHLCRRGNARCKRRCG